MATKKTAKYHRIRYNVDQLAGCCGIGVVHGFTDEDVQLGWGSNRRAAYEPEFATKEEQAEACWKDILESTWEGDEYTTIILTLVTKYEGNHKAPQFPEFREFLLKKGFAIREQFVNPNHGNEVALLTIHIPERIEAYREMYGLDEVEEDDNW